LSHGLHGSTRIVARQETVYFFSHVNVLCLIAAQISPFSAKKPNKSVKKQINLEIHSLIRTFADENGE
jgi:hypothetical protein